jgi:hypothetical protein
MSRVLSLALLVLLWFGFSQSAETGEIVSAIAVTALAAGWHLALRRYAGAPDRPRVRWVWQALRAWPRTILADTWVIARAVPRARALAGEMRRVHVGEPSPAALAWTIVGTTISPNMFVVGHLAESKELVVHELVPTQRPPWSPR